MLRATKDRLRPILAHMRKHGNDGDTDKRPAARDPDLVALGEQFREAMARLNLAVIALGCMALAERHGYSVTRNHGGIVLRRKPVTHDVDSPGAAGSIPRGDSRPEE